MMIWLAVLCKVAGAETRAFSMGPEPNVSAPGKC